MSNNLARSLSAVLVRALPVALAAALAAACSSAAPSGASSADAGGPDPFGHASGHSDGGGVDPAADGGTASSTPCDTYIACTAATIPAGLDAILAAYGADGVCWKQGNDNLCTQACRTGTVATHKLYPDEAACNVCASASDCPSREPGCDTTAGKCVECISSADCTEPGRSGCNVATHTCVECTADSQCAAFGAASFCDLGTFACVACRTNADCTGGGICDAGTKSCRGCTADQECASGVCGSSGACLECRTDAQCTGAKPHCVADYGVCVECATDAECAPGVCSFGTCCGKNACADAGSHCGSAIDPACIFTPVDCGSCGSGDTCLSGQCKPTPVKTCNASNCSGTCAFVPEHADYECSSAPTFCTGTAHTCPSGFFCENVQINGNDDYFCRPQCLTNADCGVSGTCNLLIGPTTYGYCS